MIKTTKFFIVFLLASFLHYSPSVGQIIYTDIIPDTTILLPQEDSTNLYSFDINQDSIHDFQISSQYWYQSVTPSCCYCESNYIGSIDTNSKIAWRDTGIINGSICTNIALDSGAKIDNRFWWQSSVALNFDCPPMFLSCSQPIGKKFYGIKFYFQHNYYFGWIRIRSSLSSVTIYDMAINMTPDQPIAAGQTVAGINDRKISVVTIYPNPVSDKVIIKYSLPENCYFELFNLMGVKNASELLTSGTKTKDINLNKLNSGIYFYSIIDMNGNIIKKDKIIIIN